MLVRHVYTHTHDAGDGEDIMKHSHVDTVWMKTKPNKIVFAPDQI